MQWCRSSLLCSGRVHIRHCHWWGWGAGFNYWLQCCSWCVHGILCIGGSVTILKEKVPTSKVAKSEPSPGRKLLHWADVAYLICVIAPGTSPQIMAQLFNCSQRLIPLDRLITGRLTTYIHWQSAICWALVGVDQLDLQYYLRPVCCFGVSRVMTLVHWGLYVSYGEPEVAAVSESAVWVTMWSDCLIGTVKVNERLWNNAGCA